MSRFLEVFPKGKAFLPVIHVEGEQQAIRNAHVAFSNGADGIFLIGHGMSSMRLSGVYDSIRSIYQSAWIGINYLDLGPAAIGLQPKSASGLWVDNGLIDMRNPKPAEWAAMQWRIVEGERGSHSPENFLYFGGVHYKGQDQSSDPAEMARIASPYMDVVTTSGPGTGRPADPAKLELMKRAMGDSGHLGLASGGTPENVHLYKDYVDAFLVATGVSSSFTELHPGKVAAFAANCR